MSESEEKYSPSNEKQHYDTLIKAFKFLVSSLVVLTGFAAWIIGGNLGDMKREQADELRQLKAEIQAMKSESQQVARASNEQAEKQIDRFQKNIETYLTLTKDYTSMQVSAIREDAKNLALSSTRQKVEEAFNANDIQRLVESTAKTEIGDRLNEIVEREIAKTTQLFDEFPILTTVYDRIRWGDRPALDLLDSLATNSNNPTIKKVARGYLLQKGIDYEQSLGDTANSKVSQNEAFQQLGIKTIPSPTKTDSSNVISALVSVIMKDNDLNRVTYAFIALNRYTRSEFKTFDISAVKKKYVQSH